MIEKELSFFFERFATLNFYYKQVAEEVGAGCTPFFYRYCIAPMKGEELNRVYEVEEHMGSLFMEELAKMYALN